METLWKDQAISVVLDSRLPSQAFASHIPSPKELGLHGLPAEGYPSTSATFVLKTSGGRFGRVPMGKEGLKTPLQSVGVGVNCEMLVPVTAWEGVSGEAMEIE